MKLIVCVDDSLGMLFHNRRQSQDRQVRERILERTAGSRLWMNGYSKKQFDDAEQICVAEDCLDAAGPEEFCFVENIDVAPYQDKITQIILYHWNRKYPSDFRFSIPLDGWKLQSTDEFSGSSHNLITEEVYTR